jgi:rRNA maturation protein Nop10
LRIYLPLCWFNRHAPKRRTAKKDRDTFVAKCRFCGEKVRRMAPGKWKLDTL